MKKKFALVLAVLLVFLSSTVAFADFGDYAGGSDWGYSDFGGSDWGGFDSGWGSDYDYGGNYYYYDSDTDDDISLFEFIIIAVVFIIIFGAIFGRNSIGKNVHSGPKNSVNIPNYNNSPLVNDIAGLKARDPGFNESKFLGDAANLYVRMQNAWTDRDLSPIRTRFTEELYAKSQRQVESYIRNGQTNHVERISVLNSRIIGCTSDAKNDIITVELVARIVDYITDDRTGNIIRGDRNRELFMTYRWTFIRTLGKLTEDSGKVDDKHCPSCGAPIDLNRSAVCEYCGSVCTSGEYDWVVSDIQGISQRSVQ